MKSLTSLQGATGDNDTTDSHSFQTPDCSANHILGVGIWLVNDSTHRPPGNGDTDQNCNMLQETCTNRDFEWL